METMKNFYSLLKYRDTLNELLMHKKAIILSENNFQ